MGGYRTFWNEYQLFFHHVFINDESFPDDKKKLLQSDKGFFFINNDFTIYQEKAHPKDEISEVDFKRNYIGFILILLNLPPIKVNDFLQFHFEKFKGKKEDFLTFVYHEVKGSKMKRDGKEIPIPQNKLLLFKWCEKKINSHEHSISFDASNVFVNKTRIEEIKKLKSNSFDFSKLIKLLQEINDNFSLKNYFAVSALCRGLVDHVPPIFGKMNFNEVANYYGGSSIKKNMKRLNEMKTISDINLHGQIRSKEPLPNVNQINFGQELDLLLSEIIAKVESENKGTNS